MCRWVAAVAGMAAMWLAGSAMAAARNPELLIRDTSGEETAEPRRPLQLRRLEVDVEVLGDIAQTTVTAHVANPTDNDLEADLTLELPADSVVNGYALDIDDKMIEGVLEAPRRAKLAYEAVVRRGVDPGLGEVTRANAFRTHVSPVLSQDGRIVRVSFVTPFDSGRPYRLPLSMPEAAEAVVVRVRSADPARTPRIGTGLPLTFMAGAGGELRAEAKDRPLEGVLQLTAADGPKVTLARTAAGEVFYDISDAATATAGAARRVRIYWDSSRSRADDDHAAEIALIRGFVAARRPRTVELVELSDSAPKVEAAPTDPDGLAARLGAIGYRGATSYAGLSRSLADVCFLVSDGRPTLDAYGPRDLGCRLIAVSSTREADAGLLDAFAAASGGFRLDLMARGVDDALVQALSAGPAAVAAFDGAGTPANFAALSAPAGRFRIVGPLTRDLTLTVRLSDGAVKHYRLDGAATTHEGPGALWAASRVGALAAVDRPDSQTVLALSRRFNVASSQASFIVLEDAFDYARSGIAPPAVWGEEFLAEYAEARREIDAEATEARAERLEHVLEAWEAQKAWWRERYDRNAKLDSPQRGRRDRYGYSVGGVGPGGVEEIVVTATRIGGPSISLAVEPWNPQRPYLEALRAAPLERFWAVYEEQLKMHGGLPAFYLDVAEHLFRGGRAAEARRVAADAAELPTADSTTLITLADRFARYGDRRRAMWLYERVAVLEPDRPQPLRHLALALVDRAERPGTSEVSQRADYRRALELLGKVVLTPWEGAFDGVEMISLMEANRIVAKLDAMGERQEVLDRRLVALLDVDIRVVLDWNTDATDMDLWVDEPSGERAFYGNPETQIGGHMSDDMTGGYGPEEYLLRRAADGTYEIRLDVFATDQLNPNGTTTVRATLFRNYGRRNERRETLEIDLKGDEADALVGRFVVK